MVYSILKVCCFCLDSPSPDGNGILFCASLAQKRFSVQQDQLLIIEINFYRIPFESHRHDGVSLWCNFRLLVLRRLLVTPISI